MTFIEFAKHWIALNIKENEMYGKKVAEFVLELATTLSNQHHSGVTWTMTIGLFKTLLKDYEEQS